jgi:raffinose/stachyose/melibiose transport system substrate-binding protein
MFKKIKLIALSTLLFTTAAPVSAQDEQVTLVVWDHLGDLSGASDAPDTMQVIYDKFMEENPTITIQREVIQAQEMENIVPTALSSGEGPDVVYYDLTPARGLFNSGLFLPLDTYAEQYGWTERLTASAIPWITMDDKFAAMPMESEFVGIFVNNDIFEQEGWQVPTNLEETLAYCRAASEAGYVPFAHGQNPGWQTFFSFTMPLHNTVGVEWVENRVFNNEGSWDDPGVVQSISTFYRDMRDANCFDPDVNGLEWQTQIDLFTSGEAPLFPTGTWVIGDLTTNMPDATITMIPFPQLVEGMPRVYTVGMGSGWFVSATTEHPDAAAKLLDFIVSPFAVEQLVEGANFVPPVELNAADYEVSPLQGFALNTLANPDSLEGDIAFGYNVDVLAPLEFNRVLQEDLQAVMADEKTPEEVAADLQQAWEEGQ